MGRKTLSLLGIMLATLAAIGLAALVTWNQFSGSSTSAAPRPGEGELIVAPGIQVGGAFSLTDHRGHSVTHEDFQGRFMLVYFGYSFCPDICPTELSSIGVAMDVIAETDRSVAEKIAPVFITLDPDRDTVEVLSEYAPAFHPDLVGLTGSKEAIDAVAKKYRVYYAPGDKSEDEFYLVNHSGYVYLMGPDGEFVTMFHGGTSADIMAEALIRYAGKAPTG